MKIKLYRTRFLWGILAGIAAAILVSCSAAPSRVAPGPRLIGTVAAGQSNTRGTVDEDSLSGLGSNLSVRAEVTQAVDYFKNTEVGLRVSVGARDSDAEPDGIAVHAESGELSTVGTFRGYFPVDESLAFYGETFAGYAQNWGTVRGGVIDADGDGGGALFGAGVGLAWTSGLRIGLEWSRRQFDIDPIDLQADDIAIVVGGVLRF